MLACTTGWERRNREEKRAAPVWVNYEKIRKVYAEARRQRAAGRSVCVDHIVPLNHVYVCGLHCVSNLRIISARENELKSNYYWPDMWHEQHDFFGTGVEQYELQLSMQ